MARGTGAPRLAHDRSPAEDASPGLHALGRDGGFHGGDLGPELAAELLRVAELGRQREGVVVELEGPGGGAVRARVRSDGASIGDAVTIGIRPEHLQLLPVPEESGPLVSRIAMIEDVGDHAIVHVEREAVGGRVLVRVDRPPAATGAPGRLVRPPPSATSSTPTAWRCPASPRAARRRRAARARPAS